MKGIEKMVEGWKKEGMLEEVKTWSILGLKWYRTDTARQSEGEVSRGVQSVQEHRGAQGMRAQQDSDSDKSKIIRGTHTEELAGRNRGGQEHEGTDAQSEAKRAAEAILTEEPPQHMIEEAMQILRKQSRNK